MGLNIRPKSGRIANGSRLIVPGQPVTGQKVFPNSFNQKTNPYQINPNIEFIPPIPSRTPSATVTPTPSSTPSVTPTPTITSTITPTPTITSTITPTPSLTPQDTSEPLG